MFSIGTQRLFSPATLPYITFTDTHTHIHIEAHIINLFTPWVWLTRWSLETLIWSFKQAWNRTTVVQYADSTNLCCTNRWSLAIGKLGPAIINPGCANRLPYHASLWNNLPVSFRQPRSSLPLSSIPDLKLTCSTNPSHHKSSPTHFNRTAFTDFVYHSALCFSFSVIFF